MKKILLIILMFIPIFINAECNLDTQREYIKYAYDVSYDSEYNKTNKKHDVILYNVNDKLKVKYDGKFYEINDNKVYIKNVKEGTSMKIDLYAPSGCEEPARIIYIDQPYFNPYYGSTMCYGYDGKITYCTYQFLSMEPSLELVENAINNYESGYVIEEEEEEEEEVVIETTFSEKVVNLIDTRLIKLFMFLFTAYVTYVIYNDLYIKVKHKL